MGRTIIKRTPYESGYHTSIDLAMDNWNVGSLRANGASCDADDAIALFDFATIKPKLVAEYCVHIPDTSPAIPIKSFTRIHHDTP